MGEGACVEREKQLRIYYDLSSYIGMNSILVYVGHGILWRHFPFSWEMDEYGGHGEKLAMSMTGTALWCLIAYYLFTKNVFLKI